MVQIIRETAAAVDAERDDGLTGQISLFEEHADRCRKIILPDGRAKINDIISRKVRNRIPERNVLCFLDFFPGAG